ncbi:MAG: ABC transporter ATP-binding protein [Actinobacteria bacterium]|nr:ABC transporter ATP-binding protein [Actinomycetota bacterium]
MTGPVTITEVPVDAPPTTAVSLRGVSKAFGHGSNAVVALEGISLDVRRGEFVCLVGASGCGKSTSLNIIAGLDHPTVGEVKVEGRSALMFQDAALFPWLTVRDNVALPLQLAGVGRAKRQHRAEELLEKVHLKGQGRRRPHELSGGMRQRVALARALAQDVDILLMDEPFGALDAMTRDLLHDELERLWSTTGLTVVFVTHNVREAARLSDRIVLLTSLPGKVAHQFDVNIDRPRRIDSPEVSGLAARVTDRLRQEVSRHGH